MINTKNIIYIFAVIKIPLRNEIKGSLKIRYLFLQMFADAVVIKIYTFISI